MFLFQHTSPAPSIMMKIEPHVVALAAFNLLLQFIIIPLAVRKSFGVVKESRVFDLTECIMSLSMSSLVGVCSVLSLYHRETFEQENCGWFLSGCEALVCYLISHMLYCIWHQGFSCNKVRVWIAHHSVSILAVSIVSTRPILNVTALNLGSLFMEVSNPFTNSVFLLQHIGYSLDNSLLFVVLCAAWIISFVGTRLVPMPYIFYIYFDCYLGDNLVARCLDRAYVGSLFFMFSTISVLNIYWFSQMVSGALSFLFVDKSDANKKNPLAQYKTD